VQRRHPGHPVPASQIVGLGYNFEMASVVPSLRVKVLFFGRLRELTGLAEETGELPEGATLAQVF
jgi:hypothetical protein